VALIIQYSTPFSLSFPPFSPAFLLVTPSQCAKKAHDRVLSVLISPASGAILARSGPARVYLTWPFRSCERAERRLQDPGHFSSSVGVCGQARIMAR
jgi:ABC-type iron transport system FetAB ATPase subunit